MDVLQSFQWCQSTCAKSDNFERHVGPPLQALASCQFVLEKGSVGPVSVAQGAPSYFQQQ